MSVAVEMQAHSKTIHSQEHPIQFGQKRICRK